MGVVGRPFRPPEGVCELELVVDVDPAVPLPGGDVEHELRGVGGVEPEL